MEQRDIAGWLPRLFHVVAGVRQRPTVYGSSGGLNPASSGGGVISRYAAAPGRLPFELPTPAKDLLAVLAQMGQTRARVPEEPPAVSQ